MIFIVLESSLSSRRCRQAPNHLTDLHNILAPPTQNQETADENTKNIHPLAPASEPCIPDDFKRLLIGKNVLHMYHSINTILHRSIHDQLGPGSGSLHPPSPSQTPALL